STFGQWFFEAVQETTSGPGKLLLHSGRVDTPIAVLYSHRDLFAATILGEMVQDQPWAGDGNFLDQHEGLLRGIRDLGYQYRHITFEQLEEGLSPDDYRVLVLPLASCLSDGQVDVIREFVEKGGTLLVDGRAGMLTGEGRIRNARPLDEVLGVRGEAGLEALMRASASAPLAIEAAEAGGLSVQGTEAEVRVLEPGLQVDGATALATAGDVPVLAVNELGEGRAVTLNADLRGYSGSRLEDRHWLVDQALAATLRAAGLEPPARVTLPDGARPLCVQQVLFGDGPARYLALSQDILARGLAQQQLHIELPQPSIVYDLRAGERIGEGAVSEWDATISRGEPLVYSLLPYEVEAVALRAPADVERGQTAEIAVSVGVSEGQPADHVVRIDLFAPGTEAPHRQYSQNVLCEDGAGSATIPFALDDTRGTWRVEAHDVASGVSVRQELQMR
ncbi:MAG: beta-galactosidase trimerization domain-containing protein, partial [Armatimonadota bacterium]